MKYREYVFDLSKGSVGILEVALQQLDELRGTTQKPNLLEWQIRCYNWILAQPDAEKRASAWLKFRRTSGGKFAIAGKAAGFPEPLPTEHEEE